MPNEQFTPRYLFKLATVYEADNQFDEAVMRYQQIISDYPGYTKVDDAKKYLARASVVAAKKK